MLGIVKFLAVIVLAAAGWFLRGWRPRIALVVNRWLPRGLLGVWLMEAIAGITFGPEAPHRVLGHVAVVAAWLVAPLGAGIFLYAAVAEGTTRCWVGAAAAGLSVVAVLLTAVTGYMGPTRAATGAQHILRFELLHLFVAPALAAAVLIGWAFLARLDSKDIE